MPGENLNGRIEVVFSADEIARRIDALAHEIAATKPEPLLVLALLTGSFVFAADLIRGLERAGLHPEIDFVSLSSYKSSTQSQGHIEVLRDLAVDVGGRNILIVDDILDTGRTLAFARDMVAARGAARIWSCVLLDKRARRTVAIKADFRAFDCPDDFVVGYGMDYAHRYRELPYVGRIVEG
jgi:hypoxanthine phosphoribosyltransferase